MPGVEKARQLRTAAIQADKERIAAALQRNGGSFAEWHKRLQPFYEDINRQFQSPDLEWKVLSRGRNMISDPHKFGFGANGIARKTTDLSPATNRFNAAASDVTNLGDVAMMLKFPTDWKVFEPETATVHQVTDGMQPWQADVKSEVLFLGDSFANIYSLEPMGWGESAGLVEHLSLMLGLPVDKITRNDAGSFATREMLAKDLQRGNDRLAGKKLVIWEFASRELAFGDWKNIPLALKEKQEAEMYVPPTGKTVDVRSTVRAVSPAPKPGSVPYKDHIVMVLADCGSVEA